MMAPSRIGADQFAGRMGGLVDGVLTMPGEQLAAITSGLHNMVDRVAQILRRRAEHHVLTPRLRSRLRSVMGPGGGH